MNSRKRKNILFLSVMFLISLVAILNLVSLIEETDLLKGEAAQLEDEVSRFRTREKQLSSLQEEMRENGWHKTSPQQAESLLLSMLQEKGIILSGKSEIGDERKQIRFRMGRDKVWRNLVPWLSYLSGSFTEQEWNFSFDREEADIILSYKVEADADIWLNDGLLAEFRGRAEEIELERRSNQALAPGEVGEDVLAEGADLFTYSSGQAGGSNLFSFNLPFVPEISEPKALPAHIEVRGYITTGGNSYFLVEISGEKKLIDTTSGCDNISLEKLESGYILSYEEEKYILRR